MHHPITRGRSIPVDGLLKTSLIMRAIKADFPDRSETYSTVILNIDKALYILKRLKPLLVTIEKKGVDQRMLDKIMELFPDIGLPEEANEMPAVPFAGDPYSRAILHHVFHTTGLIDALNTTSASSSLQEVIDDESIIKDVQCFTQRLSCLGQMVKGMYQHYRVDIKDIITPASEEIIVFGKGVRVLQKFLSKQGVEQEHTPSKLLLMITNPDTLSQIDNKVSSILDPLKLAVKEDNFLKQTVHRSEAVRGLINVYTEARQSVKYMKDIAHVIMVFADTDLDIYEALRDK